jgi:hypothetical protein
MAARGLPDRERLEPREAGVESGRLGRVAEAHCDLLKKSICHSHLPMHFLSFQYIYIYISFFPFYIHTFHISLIPVFKAKVTSKLRRREYKLCGAKIKLVS